MYLVRDLVSPRTWLAFIHHFVGVIFGGLAVWIVVPGLVAGAMGMPVAMVGMPILGTTLRFTDWFARAERARFAVTLGEQIPAWPEGSRSGYRMRLLPRLAKLGEHATWREVLYTVTRGPLSAAAAFVSLGLWAVGLVMVTLPLYDWSLPGADAHLAGLTLHESKALPAALAGLLVLLAAPQVTRGLAAADAALARRLLGPPSSLAARVAELELSRERVVDAAEAERKRIERDLHDGAQQRLVALAMELGRAKAKFGDDVDAARVLVDQAHAQAKAALTELRDLVRGVHPPVLTDRGLDAALSGLIARSPVPVEMSVEMPVRPRAAVEAVAYFVVAEALTNVAKHSRASQAKVAVDERGYPPVLTVMISDDGIGGADPEGAGLSGLADRVGGVDGRLTVESPHGGPTIIAAELPCLSPGGNHPPGPPLRSPGGPTPPDPPCDPRGEPPPRTPPATSPGGQSARTPAAGMRVAIAEDSVLLREGLTRLLAEAGHEVVAAETDAEAFLRAVASCTPDVCVVDVRMPPTFTDEGLRAALVIRDRWPDTGVLVLSQWVEERYATELISGRPHGVGYLLKDRVADVGEFLDALRRVAEGGSALDPEVVAQLLARSRHPLSVLTSREREVLALMAEGRSNSAIAETLVVSGGAVGKHINSIFSKLGLASGEHDHRRVLAVLRYLNGVTS